MFLYKQKKKTAEALNCFFFQGGSSITVRVLRIQLLGPLMVSYMVFEVLTKSHYLLRQTGHCP